MPTLPRFSINNYKGYTLIELLVVLTIIAILATVVFVNFKNFSKNQILIKAIGQIQSVLRLAQSNATSSVKCGGVGGSAWSVKFGTDKSKVEVFCENNTTAQKTLSLENAAVQSIKCAADGVTFDPPLTVKFSPLYGNVSFLDSPQACVVTTSIIIITLENLTNTASTKSFTISKGGAIDVQ